MKSAFLVALLMTVGVEAQAAGRQEASVICAGLSFDSERNQCIAAIRGFNYFEQGAIDICKTMSFDSEKVNCLTLIGDKAYDRYEIDNCRTQSFESDKTNCLVSSGRPYNRRPGSGCVNTQDLIYDLQSLDLLVDQGNKIRARGVIHTMIQKLQSCPL